MFYFLAVLLSIAGIGCIAYDPADTQLLIQGFLLETLAIAYVLEWIKQRKQGHEHTQLANRVEANLSGQQSAPCFKVKIRGGISKV